MMMIISSIFNGIPTCLFWSMRNVQVGFQKIPDSIMSSGLNQGLWSCEAELTHAVGLYLSCR